MDNIRRQYSLPNCTLILEGYGDSAAPLQPDARPLMSILVNAECRFAGDRKPLDGGRDFFESLVTAVSGYAQEFLSGVPQPIAQSDNLGGVQLYKIDDKNLHRLMVRSASSGGQENHTTGVLNPGDVFIDLTNVQLFDLVEAVDQFLADSRTLPDLSLQLTPVSKRYVASREPLAKRATPAAVGVGSLALAAIAFSLVPFPREVQRPVKGSVKEPQSSATPSAAPTPSSSPSNSPQPTPSSALPTLSPSLESLLTSVQEINDPTQLRYLERKLQKNIKEVWQTRRQFEENLVYKVGVGKDGAIVGYEAINAAAREGFEETPLRQLRYIPVDKGSTESVAQFRVVFTKRGVPQVSPWRGYSSEPGLGPEITDRDQLRDLGRQLSEQLNKNWTEPPTYKRNLVYRVAVNKEGVIADYEPINQPAFDYEKETPLLNLSKSSDSEAIVPQEPLAQFQVVFKPRKKLEVGAFPGKR